MIAGPLMPIYMPAISAKVIVPESVDHFCKVREERFGMPLEKVAELKGGEQAWEAAKPGFQALEALLEQHKQDEGPFILGSRVSYADFMIVSLAGLRKIDAEMWERCLGMDGMVRLRELLQECEKRGWTAKDD
jgi:glutathione S-transferase